MTVWQVMLDTNIVSHIMRYPASEAAARMAEYSPDQLAISSVVLSELLFGASKANSRRFLAQIDFVRQTTAVLPFEEEAAASYAEIRVHIERAGTPIGSNDTLIAAHALALDVTLITYNIREFSRVPGLRVENWLD